LLRSVEVLRPDVIHAHGSLVYASAATRSGLPAVVTVHGIMAREASTLQDPRKRIARALDSWFERRTLRHVQDLIAISPYVLDFYPRLASARVRHIDNPVDDSYFDIRRAEEPCRILCPVRVIPRKGLLFALQALPGLLSEFPNLQLRVAGEKAAMPSYQAACQSFIQDQGLAPHVRFLGNLSAAELAEEYAHCTLMLLPSMQETAPVVIGEAMAAAVPIVATRVGGVPYLLQHGSTALLVDYGDTDGLVAALRGLLRDSSLRHALGSRGRIQAEDRFRLSVVADRTVQVYEEIADRHAPSAAIPSAVKVGQ
jgi:glycosyltransferase involved in cell wall biosynthesis